MTTGIVLILCLLTVVSVESFGRRKTSKRRQLTIEDFYPTKRLNTCNLKYKDVVPSSSFVCNDERYSVYPKQCDDELLKAENSVYQSTIDITKNCEKYEDLEGYAQDSNYYYRSLCRVERTPVNVVWVDVMSDVVGDNVMGANYTLPNGFQTINNGLLPMHVVKGQQLYDVACFHPFYKGFPKSWRKGRIRSYLRRFPFNDLNRHFCNAGYGLSVNLMCKTNGFVDRTLVVYSTHLNRFFSVVIHDIPTSCVCTTCECVI